MYVCIYIYIYIYIVRQAASENFSCREIGGDAAKERVSACTDRLGTDDKRHTINKEHANQQRATLVRTYDNRA